MKLLCDCVLERFTCLEEGNLACRDLDLFASLGVTADTNAALLNIKNAEANHLNLFAGYQSLNDGIKCGVDSLLGVLLGKTGLLCDGCYKFCLNPPNLCGIYCLFYIARCADCAVPGYLQ